MHVVSFHELKNMKQPCMVEDIKTKADLLTRIFIINKKHKRCTILIHCHTTFLYVEILSHKSLIMPHAFIQ